MYFYVSPNHLDSRLWPNKCCSSTLWYPTMKL